MPIEFSRWEPFSDFYDVTEPANGRALWKFSPKDFMKNQQAGIYMIGEQRNNGITIIYIGMSCGKKKVTCFNDRIHKHALKAVGQFNSSGQPADTVEWQNYRAHFRKQKESFGSWYLSFCVLHRGESNDINALNEKVNKVENQVLIAFALRHQGQLPECNGTKLPEIVWPAT